MEFRNDSPQGALYIPFIGLVEAGASFDAVGEDAEPFLAQPGNYTHVIHHDDGSKSDAPKPAAEPQAGVYVTTGEHLNAADPSAAAELAGLATAGEPADAEPATAEEHPAP